MAHTDETSQVIEAELAASFRKVRARLIDLREVIGSEGEPILLVHLAVPGAPGDVDYGDLAEMQRLLRRKLFDLGETRFPVFSIHTLTEAASDRPDAA